MLLLSLPNVVYCKILPPSNRTSSYVLHFLKSKSVFSRHDFKPVHCWKVIPNHYLQNDASTFTLLRKYKLVKPYMYYSTQFVNFTIVVHLFLMNQQRLIFCILCVTLIKHEHLLITTKNQICTFDINNIQLEYRQTVLLT